MRPNLTLDTQKQKRTQRRGDIENLQSFFFATLSTFAPLRAGFCLSILMLLAASPFAFAQTAAADSTPSSFQHGGIYDRPYILNLGGKTAIGGYAEMNANYTRDGEAEREFSFEARRFNVFFYSAISAHVKLTSELEFEHGTEEIALETALADVLLATPVNFRMGVLLSPIGRFNLTHDSPRYNITDRPLVSTQIIPSTLSEVGAGLFGAFYLSAFDRFTYELYAVNGLSENILLANGTSIPAGKSAEALEEDNNGVPAWVGRLAYNPRFGGEFGFSFYHGRYNGSYNEDGEEQEAQAVRLLAGDAEYRWRKLLLRGEAAFAHIDIPAALQSNDLFAESQRGFFVEGNYTLLRRPMLGMPEATLTLVSRFDAIDLNVGKSQQRGDNLGEATRRMTFGLSFRPTSETALRLSYWHQQHDDIFNRRATSSNVQFSLATYF